MLGNIEAVVATSQFSKLFVSKTARICPSFACILALRKSVCQNHEQAVKIDNANGNTKRQDTIKLELKQIDEHETFQDKGKGCRPSAHHTKTKAHFVFCVKACGCHKAQAVAGGDIADTPVDSVCSSVVSIRGIRILTFLGKLNNMEAWATDIGMPHSREGVHCHRPRIRRPQEPLSSHF